MNFICQLLRHSQATRNAVQVSYRNYPRWTSRTPLKVLTNEEDQKQEKPEEKSTTDSTQETKQSLQEAIKVKWRYQVDSATPSDDEVEVIERENKSPKKKKRKPTQVQINTTDMLETVINERGEVIYTKMQSNDSRISRLLVGVKTKKALEKRDLILLEGTRLIRDALLAGCTLKYLLFTRRTELDLLKPDLPRCGAKMYKMPYKEMQMWSDLTTTPGIMGLFRTPNTEHYIAKDQLPLTIYCDNVREPGNLGAILRVAASAGCQKVLLSVGCTGLWDAKVTRSAAGAQFRVRIQPKINVDDLRKELTGGPEEEANKMLFIADNNLVNAGEAKNEDDRELAALINQIPVIPYYGVSVKEVSKQGKEIVLVVGGETHGIHADVYKLAKEVGGVRLNIPMSNGVESLNTGIAAGIITFELYKQFMSGGNAKK